MKPHLLPILLLALLPAGCRLYDNPVTDLSQKPEAWGGYHPGQIYILQQPVDLLGHGAGDEYNILRPKAATKSPTVAELDPSSDLLGTLSPGTQLQAEKIIHLQTPYYNHDQIILKILDGPFAKRLIQANELSTLHPLTPNPAFLSPEPPQVPTRTARM